MKKKLVLFGLIFIVTIFSLTGCSISKNKVTGDAFKNQMTAANFTVVDCKSQFERYDYVSEVYLARHKEYGYQVEFYVLKDKEYAKSFYSNNKNLFESSKTKTYTEAKSSGKNYDKFVLETNNKYKVLTRVENTVLYINIDSKYKEKVNKVIKNLGY